MMNELRELLRECGDKIIMKYFTRLKIEDVNSKGRLDYVTIADKESEEFLAKNLLTLYDAGICGEEGALIEKEEMIYIDPVDGTINFIHGIPYFCISLSCIKKDEIIWGAIYEPTRDEFFYAEKGKGTYLNNKRVEVNKIKELSGSIITFGFPVSAYNVKDKYISFISSLFGNVNALRWLGSAALDLAYISCGRVEAAVQFNMKKWDIGAGILMIRESGGIVTDFEGNENILEGSIIAGNQDIQKELFKYLKKFF